MLKGMLEIQRFSNGIQYRLTVYTVQEVFCVLVNILNYSITKGHNHATFSFQARREKRNEIYHELRCQEAEHLWIHLESSATRSPGIYVHCCVRCTGEH